MYIGTYIIRIRGLLHLQGAFRWQLYTYLEYSIRPVRCTLLFSGMVKWNARFDRIFLHNILLYNFTYTNNRDISVKTNYFQQYHYTTPTLAPPLRAFDFKSGRFNIRFGHFQYISQVPVPRLPHPSTGEDEYIRIPPIWPKLLLPKALGKHYIYFSMNFISK